MSEWVRQGYFLDLTQIEESLRPSACKSDFAYVLRRQKTIAAPFTLTLAPKGETVNNYKDEDVIDFYNLQGLPNNFLKPKKNMIFQCAYGFYPNVMCYLEHPIDNTVGKLPNVLPQQYWDVGIIRQTDSPYEEPNLDKTEFWITNAEGCFIPRFHFKNPFPDLVNVFLKIVINELVITPVEDPELVEQLAKHKKPSTPAFLKVVQG